MSDAGLQAERTVLAWRRTQFSVFLVAVLAVRCFSHHPAFALFISSQAALLAMVMTLGQRRRYDSHRAALLSAEAAASPLRIVLLSLYVSSITLAALMAVLLWSL
ncbi:DUF202 domain-containing protein [Pseudomonas sp. ADAK18]|uniref:DUF202 domain-containing protein n=1 Tax=Pseudomonas sp. ADAK18 TaxID=2730848 RepID=UPI001F1F11D1|nr:DUF202 domain-containing protein [Pseudomonas sp. ADAK18]